MVFPCTVLSQAHPKNTHNLRQTTRKTSKIKSHKSVTALLRWESQVWHSTIIMRSCSESCWTDMILLLSPLWKMLVRVTQGRQWRNVRRKMGVCLEVVKSWVCQLWKNLPRKMQATCHVCLSSLSEDWVLWLLCLDQLFEELAACRTVTTNQGTN